MQELTLILAAVLACTVLLLRPPYAFSVFIITLLFYPVYLVLQLGTVNISVGRIVVTVLLIRCLLNLSVRNKFKWHRLDYWVTFNALIHIFIAATFWKMPLMASVQNVAGNLMDTYLAYLTARLCLNDDKAIIISMKWIAFALVPLAILGVVESLTGWGPYTHLVVYCPWLEVSEPTLNVRSGFYRAGGSFSHPILFGAVFAMFFPLVFWLRHQSSSWRIISYVIIPVLIIGTLSSMSSGPVMMLIFTICFVMVEHHKNWVKPLLVFLAISCVFVEIFSNRPFYHVLASYADPFSGAGWHRAKLIDLAIEHFHEWWLVGYGQTDPGWGPALGMSWTDITNHYLITGVRYGMFGVVALFGMLFMSLHMLIQINKVSKNPLLKSWLWALGSVMVAFIISFNAFTVYGQANTLFYCLLGFVGSSNNFGIWNNTMPSFLSTKRKSA